MVGRHDDYVRALARVDGDANVWISGSYDNTVAVWDTRVPGNNNPTNHPNNPNNHPTNHPNNPNNSYILYVYSIVIVIIEGLFYHKNEYKRVIRVYQGYQ